MSTTLTLSGLSVKVNWSNVNNLLYGTPTDSGSFSWSLTMQNGSALNQCSKLFIDQSNPTLAAGASVTYILTAAGGGTMKDAFGNTLTFAAVKLIYFEWQNTGSGAQAVSAKFGGAATNGFTNWIGTATDYVTVRNGGVFYLCAPDATAYAVTASTADQLKITNNDGSNAGTYRIIIAGV